MQSFNRYNLSSTIASYYNQTFILPAFQHFLFIQKSKRLQKKSKLCPQKGKQASLKSKSFCAMLRKKRLKCGRIPARLFLACHQKSNTFKCKQFCCAKPMCACLFMGCAPRPRERRAAVLSSRLSVSCSAHSHANAPELERVCNITEAPPVADEARRCWRKTRSIAPAPRAIGDYVLRVARAACFASRSLAYLS